MSESRFTDPTGTEHAPGMAPHDGYWPPLGMRQSPETVTSDPIAGVTRAAPSGTPARWSSAPVDPTALPNHESKVTRSRKRGASFVAGTGAAHTRTVGDVHAVDPVADMVATVIVSDGSDDDAAGIIRERKLVAAADAWLSMSEGRKVVSPQGNVTEWDDEHRLGGLALTDRPFARMPRERAMRQQMFGGRDGRGMVDATYVVDEAGEAWCDVHDVDAAECWCDRDHRADASIGACAVQRFTAADVMAAPVGHDGETVVSDATVDRKSVPVRLTAAERVALDLGRDDAKGRPMRGVDVGSGVVRLVGPIVRTEPGRWEMVRGSVPLNDGSGKSRPASLPVWVPGRSITVPVVGSEPLPRSFRAGRKVATTTTARKRSARAGRDMIDRRNALAAELAEVLAGLSVGGHRFATVDGAEVKLGHPRRDRWTVGTSAGSSPARAATNGAKVLAA